MPFEYSCFVSYPHGRDEIIKPFVQNFIKGLKAELYPFTKKEVYYDDGLLAGHKMRGELGQNLCRSVCMILIYTPIYFDKDNLNCARELKAMDDLERKRLRKKRDKGKGLIIPVIFRGADRFPQKLKESTFYNDFTDISFSNTRADKISNKYATEIRKIAEYIFKRCEEFDEFNEDVWKACDEFLLPDDDEVKEYVETVFGKKIFDNQSPFPNRMKKTDED